MLYYDPHVLIEIFSLKGKSGTAPSLPDGSNELITCCPFQHYKPDRGHYYERNPSFAINIQLGKWNCYACMEAGHDLSSLAWKLDVDLGVVPRVQRGEIKVPAEDPFPLGPEYLDVLSAYPEIASAYLNSRGLDGSLVSRFGIGASRRGDSIYFPLFRTDGEFVGWSERRTSGALKWLLHPEHIKREGLLYGIHLAKAAEEVILVESPMDVLYLSGLGYIAVATMGAAVNHGQIEIILDHFRLATIIPHNDGAGDLWAWRLIGGLLGRCVLYGARLPRQYKDAAEITDPELAGKILAARRAIRFLPEKPGPGK